ncbi:MAG: hypothetical protein ACXWPS_07485 [Ktedonobacteraceae bacterium]
MNTRKSILLMGLIALGVIAGGFLSFISSSGVVITGAACGGLLGGLLYCMIQMAVSRSKKEVQPYDHLDEQHPFKHLEISQTPETRVRGRQDNLMADIMNFHPPKH